MPEDVEDALQLSAKLEAENAALSAQMVELQKELAEKNKPVVCYNACAMHKNVPWEMKVSVMVGPVATVCPICHPPEQGA